ncbi:MAG: sialidase family protein, partial [Planctomycetaceae bacterium]
MNLNPIQAVPQARRQQHRVSRVALTVLALLISGKDLAATDPPPGEIPFEGVEDELPRYLRLSSGKLFQASGKQSQTSADNGQTWQQGGRINRLTIGWKLNDVAIQLQSGKHKGRIVVPFYH